MKPDFHDDRVSAFHTSPFPLDAWQTLEKVKASWHSVILQYYKLCHCQQNGKMEDISVKTYTQSHLWQYVFGTCLGRYPLPLQHDIEHGLLRGSPQLKACC
jgi:hypothetical protein